MTETFLTVAEVAAITRETEDTTRRRCAAGQIRAVKLGDQWRVAKSEVERFMSPGKRGTTRTSRLTKRQRQALGEAS